MLAVPAVRVGPLAATAVACVVFDVTVTREFRVDLSSRVSPAV